MDDREVLFHEQLRPAPPAIISLTGGGGKTSLLFALGMALANTGRSVLCTTTTKMLLPEAGDGLTVAIEEDSSRLQPPGREALYAARPPDARRAPEKVLGYSPEDIDGLLRREFAEWILVEADGAAGRPLKAPARHEPVIPSLTGVAVAVMGLECVGKPLTEAVAFRMAEIMAITGLSPGESVTPRALANLVGHPDGMFKNVPASAKRLLFCNKADDPETEAIGMEFAKTIRKKCPGFLRGIFIGSLRRKGLRCLSLPTE